MELMIEQTAHYVMAVKGKGKEKGTRWDEDQKHMPTLVLKDFQLGFISETFHHFSQAERVKPAVYESLEDSYKS